MVEINTGIRVPASDLLSPEAQATVASSRAAPAADIDFSSDAGLLEWRRNSMESADAVKADLEAAFEVTTREESIGGVRVDIVEPAEGIAAATPVAF